MAFVIVAWFVSVRIVDAGLAFSSLRRNADATANRRSMDLNPAEAGREKAKQLESILADIVGKSTHTSSLQASHSTSGGSARSGATSDVSDIQESAMRAQIAFDRASSVETEAERALKAELRSAMKDSHVEVGRPDKTFPRQARTDCFPDYGSCPADWTMRGSVCVARTDYDGLCKREQHLVGKSVDEKRAIARACEFDWPCQAECVRDFSDSCPIGWSEVEIGVCEAPVWYEGACAQDLRTRGMSDKDKYEVSSSCDVSWPCVAPAAKNYGEICPDGWTLQSGQSCAAPKEYVGACDPIARMGGMTDEDKQAFEAACSVGWPKLPEQCQRDYNRSCPFGWMEKRVPGNTACIAPSWFKGCNGVQQLGQRTPEEKRAWATACGAPFPCTDRTHFQHDWSQICPADWFAMNGGEACLAPENYAGPCKNIQHGLVALSTAEKEAVAKTCQVEWPSVGEAGSMLVAHRTDKSPASANGPVAIANGAVHAIP